MGPLVTALLALADAYAAASGDKGLPFDGSPAMHDFAKQPQFAKLAGDQPVDNAHSLLRVTTFAGFDHLRSFARLFQGEVTPVFSHLVLARAALQTFGPVAWLAEPGITTERRIKRVLLFELEDAANRKRYGLEPITEMAHKISEHVRELAQQLNWAVIFNNQTKSVGGEVLPSTAALIAVAIGPEGANSDDPLLANTPRLVWSYLSGIAHGFSYALLQSITRGDEAATTPGLVPGTLGTDSASVTTMATAIAAAAFNAGERHLAYMGWKTSEWIAAADKLRDWAAPIVARLDTA